ncbi:restriction endonuclease subunit S [Vibrio vulnificus]|nr:restriction endonuclease subunit S [Vibrio vulnificus]EIF8195276.1 restriction endonuclease subunit S [Vibrio vulnificus]ELE7274814.1 restriction endonuclease subunit S [Vibrio vulnificus]MCU8441442.1 restriction endonuclease subunit S [Vibrio vulnificus]
MSDWYETRLGDIADICIGGTPSRAEASYWASTGEEGFPWVSISDLKSRIVSNTAESITALGARNSNVKLVPCGTIMMSFKLSLGRIAFAGRDIYTNEAIASFEVDTDKIDKTFLFYQLPEVVKLAITDTAIKGATLNKAKLNELVIPHPELVVQRKIAEILSTIDNQIDATQALIDKYAVIKQGMMADLFSRGIDPETKALRSTFEEAPELYHKTPLGMLPKEWDVIELENLLDDVATPMRSGPFGSALLKEELASEGIPLLGIDNIFVERFKASYKRFVTEQKFIELSRYAVRERDVVITIMGTVGRSCVIPKSIGLALSSKHLWTMTFDKEQILPELVCWQLNHSPWAESWFRRESQGGVMDAIQSQTLKKLKLVVPPPAEQNAIHERYENLNNHIEVNQTSLDKLKLQKAGLMQDLLTGKVPVPA